MRKLLLSALLVTTASSGLFAQNLDDVQEKISKQKYGEAKEKIDKILADAKGQKSANAWYYKGVIYNELAKDSTKDNSAYRMEAFNALKKAQELDPKNVMGELEQNWRLFDIYNYYYNTAIKYHNTKDYKTALPNYKNALEVEQYIHNKNFSYNNQTLPALDTALTLYAGSAALMAGDTATGLTWFQNLANAKVASKDYQEVYMILVDYYAKKGDQANTDKYAALGKELYPDNDYWVYYELQDPALKDNKEKLLAKYEEMIAKNPSNTVLPLDYAIETFNYTYGEKKPADYAGAQARLEAAIKKAIDVNKSAEANYLMVQHYSNKIYDVQESYRVISKSTKPEDVKKRAALMAQINKMTDESMVYGERAAALFGERNNLKLVEKANYKTLLGQLINYYKGKKNTQKVQYYETKLKEIS